jgi:hypothetical protein
MLSTQSAHKTRCTLNIYCEKARETATRDFPFPSARRKSRPRMYFSMEARPLLWLMPRICGKHSLCILCHIFINPDRLFPERHYQFPVHTTICCDKYPAFLGGSGRKLLIIRDSFLCYAPRKRFSALREINAFAVEVKRALLEESVSSRHVFNSTRGAIWRIEMDGWQLDCTRSRVIRKI